MSEQSTVSACSRDLIAGGVKRILKKNNNKMTILMAVSMNSADFSPETLAEAIDHAVKGGLLDKTDDDDWTALHYAARFSNETGSVETVKALIEAGAKLDERECKDCTPLMSAIMVCETTSSLETVELLINAGASLNLKTKDGHNALDSLRYGDTRMAIMEIIKKRFRNSDATNQRGG
jgi:ankyrin repeat protein